MNDKRRRLEDVAQASVQRAGLKSLSFRTLADEIGIKSSSVHYHFPEKSDLASALIQRYQEDFREQLDAISARRWNVKRKLAAFIAIFEQVADGERVCLCGMMAAECESLSPDNRRLLSGFFDDMESWIADLLCVNADSINAPVSTRQLAKVIVSGLEGALLLDRVAGSKANLKAQKDLILSLLK